LLLFTYTDLEKAKALAERLALDANEMLPLFLKEIRFMTANIHFLRGDYMLAKLKYRELLTMELKPKMQSQVFNNLAFASFAHVLDIPKLRESFPDKV